MKIYATKYRTNIINPFIDGYCLVRISKILYFETYIIFPTNKGAIEIVINGL